MLFLLSVFFIGIRECLLTGSSGTRRVEVVKEHSKANISIMVCGSAGGELLPPHVHVVYKATNLYEGWTLGGPSGTQYSVSKSGWFDMDIFEKWFRDVFLEAVRSKPGRKILIGDNLASHFSVNVVRMARENDILFVALPPNTTHIMQPLDVSIFRPFKRIWATILDNFRKESRSKGALPKVNFPIMLHQLYQEVKKTIDVNLKSGFRATGLSPFNPSEPLKHLPDASSNKSEIVRSLDASLIQMLRDHRGITDKVKTSRGRKVVPGRPISEESLTTGTAPGTSSSEPSTSTAGEASSSGSDDNCSNCFRSFAAYSGPDWVRCVDCLQWYCGFCNDETTDPFYKCDFCE